MRIGFTIIYDGYRHLVERGNDWPRILDYWIIIEGAANPGGSTSWCKELPKKHSTDGTVDLLKKIDEQWNNVIIEYGPDGGWASKDDMVNRVMQLIREFIGVKTDPSIFLWQIDIDESWTEDQMKAAEKTIFMNGADCGCFHADHFVGKNLIASGVWGEGNDPEDPIKNAYRRLWKWNGQNFKTHEPPKLVGGNGKEMLLPHRFKHYSYFYSEDVKFKEQYYKGYEGLHDRWLKLQKETIFPQPLSVLISGYWGKTDTRIEYV